MYTHMHASGVIFLVLLRVAVHSPALREHLVKGMVRVVRIRVRVRVRVLR